jgi:hypothetical protein
MGPCGPPSLSPLYVSHISLSKISIHLLTYRMLHDLVQLSVRPTLHLPPQPSPRTRPCPVLFASRSCLSHAPTHASSSLLPQSPCRTPTHAAGHTARLYWRTSGRSSAEPRAPMSAGHVGSPRAPRPESTGPDSPTICCKYMFHVFPMFQMYVAGVSYGCCKSRS